ncbi:MAG: AAA family ATPase [Alphaproteobacteria bacterium]|nr:AAA family ATPase [Alphaproteobacteria bacterium]
MQVAILNKQVSVDAIRECIATKMDVACFTSWIAPLDITVSDSELVFNAPNQFTADFVRTTYSNILNAVASTYGLTARISVANVAARMVKTANDNNSQTYTAPATTNDAGDFDSFVSSEENSFVVSACKKMAAGTATFSPLFIYGASGCGKSLLARCINSAARGRTIMMSGAQFVSEFARALHDRTIFAFKDYCRNCDTFIMDDVQVLSGKRATCDEFLQLIIDLRGAGKNIVLVADAAPSNLTGFDHRAQSLLASGLVADVVAPSRAVRAKMFERAGVDSAVANMIAGRVLADGHVIAGVLNKISAYREIMGESIDENVAERILADTLKKSHSPIAIVKSMCEKLGVSYDAVCGTGRARALVLARQMMMVVLKNATGLSLSEIGQYVGGRDHATVMYGIDRIEKLKAGDLVLSAQLSQMIDEYK